MEPRLSGIRQIAITVSDVDAALAFYRDVLGLAFLFQPAPTLAFLDADGIRLMLTTPQGAGTAGANSILYFQVQDIVPTQAALVAAVRRRNGHRSWPRACRTTSCGPASCAIRTETWSD